MKTPTIISRLKHRTAYTHIFVVKKKIFQHTLIVRIRHCSEKKKSIHIFTFKCTFTLFILISDHDHCTQVAVIYKLG